MVRLSNKEKENYRLYQNLDSKTKKQILEYVGSDIGANIGRFDIPKTILKKLIAIRTQMVLNNKEDLKEYINTLEILRGVK